MEVDYTYSDVRYWSEDLCCTVLLTHMSDLEGNVIDLIKIYVKSFG